MEVATKQRRTYADYAALPERAPCQLIDGELIMSPAPTPFHQLITHRLSVQFTLFVEENKLGVVLNSPIDVYLSEHETYQPDIVFVAKERFSIIGEKKIEGAPDLVVEVLSPSTGYYDLVHKKSVYEESGVKEYWIIDSKEKSVQILANKNGKFEVTAAAHGAGRVGSELLKEFAVDIARLFRPLGE